MAPIHETDIAEERWAKAEWENYELWEKIEVRLRRRKWMWVLAAALVFLGLSSIPIWIERMPKWTAQIAARRLAQEVNYVKQQAAVEHAAFRVRFSEGGKTQYQIERATRCGASEWEWRSVRTGSLFSLLRSDDFRVLSRSEGDQLGIPGLVSEFCYDPLGGGAESQAGMAGFGIIPVKDLTEKRVDRVSILLLDGPSAAVSFD